MDSSMVTAYPHSVENSLKLYRPPQSSFHDRTNRFEEYASTKNTPPGRNYTYKLSNIGPGAYDVNPASRAGEAIVIARTATLYNNERISHLDESYWPKRAGAPVGTYNLRRDMSPESTIETFNRPSSSFMSSGRTKQKMSDAELFRTKHDWAEMANVGPGMHDITSQIGDSDTSAARAKKAIARSKSEAPKIKLKLKAGLPELPKKSGPTESLAEARLERLADIDSVKNLPDFSRYH